MITFCLAEADKAGSSSTWVLSNHDVVRHASRYALPTGTDYDEWLMSRRRAPAADEDAGLRRARAATLLMLALPGSSYLYQGEELGLHEVADLPPHALQDPIWLRTLNEQEGPRRLPGAAAVDRRRATRSASAPATPGCRSRPASRGPPSPRRQGRPDSTLELYREALRVRRQLQTAEEPDLGPTDRPGGAALRPARRLALHDQLRHRSGPAARGRGPGQQHRPAARRAAGREHRLADGVAAADCSSAAAPGSSIGGAAARGSAWGRSLHSAEGTLWAACLLVRPVREDPEASASVSVGE